MDLFNLQIELGCEQLIAVFIPLSEKLMSFENQTVLRNRSTLHSQNDNRNLESSQ